jgi:hypothetical protein
MVKFTPHATLQEREREEVWKKGRQSTHDKNHGRRTGGSLKLQRVMNRGEGE